MNRHTVVSDINTLMAHGVDVVCNKSRQNPYFIGDRHFELPELMRRDIAFLPIAFTAAARRLSHMKLLSGLHIKQRSI